MAHNVYFREELTFLKEQGQVFSEIYPQLAQFLHGTSPDPDVQRLLEGFAFLTSRLRQKVDDDFPELTHSLINMLWPNYLRPMPSMSIVAFQPLSNLSDRQVIPRLTQLDSHSEMEVSCYFRTCRDVPIYPVECGEISAQHTRKATRLSIQLELLGEEGVMPTQNFTDLTFYLGGDKYSAQMLYFYISHYLHEMSIEYDGQKYSIPNSAFSIEGFDADQALLPYPKNVYDGYRILQEYLAFPEAFQFFKISELNQSLPKIIRGKLTLHIDLSRTLPPDVRVLQNSFQLYCTPVINLFDHDADPIALEGKESEYRIVPSSRYPSHYEIFSIDSVTGQQDSRQKESSNQTRSNKREYSPFESFQHEIERVRHREALYYRLRMKESRRGDGFDSFISFVRSDESEVYLEQETISVKLSCTNRLLPSELGIGDISVPTDNSPNFAVFSNITVPTASMRPVIDGSLLWILISNLSLNYLSLLSKDAICSIIRAYDFRALVDRQAERSAQLRLDSIKGIEAKPIDKILQGRPVRGLKSVLQIEQAGFDSEGDLFLFSTVLNYFFALYASINSFHELEVVNLTNQERYTWGRQTGMQALI